MDDQHARRLERTRHVEEMLTRTTRPQPVERTPVPEGVYDFAAEKGRRRNRTMSRNTMRAWRDDDHGGKVVELASKFRPLASQQPAAAAAPAADDPPPPLAWLREQHRLTHPDHWQDCGACRREKRGLRCTISVHLDNGCDLFDHSDRRYWDDMHRQLDPENNPDDTLAARRARRGQVREPRRRVTRRSAR